MAPRNPLKTKAKAISFIIQKRRDNQEMNTANDKEIEELETKLSALQSTRSTLQRKKRSLATNFGKSTDDYTCMLNRQFAAEMFERLSAREVRDMVYFHLMGGAPDVSIIQREKDLPDNEGNKYYFHVDHSDRRGQARGLDNKFEHYFREKYMGKDFVVELAEEFNRHASYNVWHIDDVPFLLSVGPLRDAPFRPLDFLRTLSVDTFIPIPNHLVPPDRDYVDLAQRPRDYVIARHMTAEANIKRERFESQVSWLGDLAATAQVSRMSVTLNVSVRTKIALYRYKAVLLPHIQTLVEKDCKVVVSYEKRGRNVYPQPGDTETVTYDRSMLLSAGQVEAAIAAPFESPPCKLTLETIFSPRRAC